MKDTFSTSSGMSGGGIGLADPVIAVFECVNSARAGQPPISSSRRRPLPTLFQWPIAVNAVRVSCAGRLQPEHILKAFEEGYDAVCVIVCAEDNCHCLEGSKRGHRRVDFVRRLLDEVGVGGNRLLFFSMPGSAREDMAAGLAPAAPAATDLSVQAATIVEQAMSAIAALPPSPFRKNRPAVEPIEKDTQASEEEESD
ncbi:MAG: hydrogenase iron-sulfur subunit [Kiritimatiellaeota bacterium]|nr:hydrogenase iron-sulfur subunit [Kiritimatiellota bacterium]